MKKIKGDLLKLVEDGKFDVIVHGCNCFHTMGAGIAAQIVKKWPSVYDVDKSTSYGDKNKLGHISIYVVDNHLLGSKPVHVVNAYTQFNYGGGSDRKVDYEAVARCFEKIAYRYKDKPVRIGYPMIGAGLARGNWDIIEKIIDVELDGFDHTLVVFE